MKPFSLKIASAAVALLSAVFAVTAVAQAPATPPAGTPPARPEFHFPPPKNLQVLPKSLTTEQVLGIMHTWAGSLGTGCDHCHAADPSHMGPNGHPMLNFADDSKPEKNTARLMYKMVEDINSNYISMVDNSGLPVTCGTCHRGHVSPPPFAVPPMEHEHHGPPGGEKPPAPPAQ